MKIRKVPPLPEWLKHSRVQAEVDFASGQLGLVQVRGPVAFAGELGPTGRPSNVVEGYLDFSSAELLVEGLFLKKPGVQGSLRARALSTPTGRTEIEAFKVHFVNTEISGRGSFEQSGHHTVVRGKNLKIQDFIWDELLLDYDRVKSGVAGSFEIKNAQFYEPHLMKGISDALTKTLAQLGQKIPFLKIPQLPNLTNLRVRYDTIAGDFSIRDKELHIPSFQAKAVRAQGIDLKGTLNTNFKDFSIQGNLDVTDTYGLTGAQDIMIENNGIRVDHLLANGASPVHFPLQLGCHWMAPCVVAQPTVDYLLKIAGQNAVRAVGVQLLGVPKDDRDQLQKKLDHFMKKLGPELPKIRENLKKYFH